MRVTGVLIGTGGVDPPRRKETHMSESFDKAKGKLKEAAGDLTDDKDLQREGKTDQAAGKVKGAVDSVKDKLTGND